MLATTLLAGCTSGGSSTDPGASACGITLLRGAWDGFNDLWDTQPASGRPAEAQVRDWAETPSCGAWRRSLAPQTPTPQRLGNWLAASWEDPHPPRDLRKINKDRSAMVMSYRYSREHRRAIDSLLTVFATPDTLCALKQRLEGWIEPARFPESLVIAVLPGRPELRVTGDTLLVDTGVLQAGGLSQTMRQLASLAYRLYQAPHAARPDELQGEESLTQAFGMLRTEGVAAYLEDRVDTYFRSEHPSLRRVKFVGRDLVYKALDLVAYSDSVLAPMLTDHEALHAGAVPYARVLIASSGFSQLGYVMAATIAGNLGEARLQAASRSAADFLEAYQEAAALNPVPAPLPGARGHAWFAAARPFDPTVARNLGEFLARSRH